ncbi:MAG TPA: SDR family oxidoreductase [Arenibacter sp.]|nr:SDR family oxidoreductase [Arenibacter sp.]
MNIILTGATGTLGSRILFSLLELKFGDLKTIYLPVRKKKSLSPQMRIKNMLLSEYAPEFIKSNKDEINSKIVVLDSEDLMDPYRFSTQEPIDYFIHSAGFVNLSTHPSAKKGIFEENLKFTQDIFNVHSPHIRKFIYISTAFAIGDIGGVLNNDYGMSKGKNYRNHYEASKHECEQFLMKEGKARNIPVQILRPSVLGGNISDAPHFFISKYMVFYLFAKFFNNSRSKEKVRISTTKGTGLNIIPTDYAAKVIVKVMDTDIEQLNIVHSQETDLRQGMSRIFETVGFTDYIFTHEKIDERLGFSTKLEQFYYETIGVHLHPYLTSKPNGWDTTLLESILPLPHYNLEDYLTDTVAFAKMKGFRNQKW